MKKKYLYMAVALLAGLASCTYPYNPDISAETEKTLVVDGEILVGGQSTIRLAYLTELDQLTNLVHPRGRAWIEDSDGNRFDSSTPNLAYTISIPTQTAKSGRKYRCVIQVDGETYVSEWVKADAAPTISQIKFDADLYNVTAYVDVDAKKSHTGYMGFTYEETWEFHASYIPDFIVNPETWSYEPLLTDWPYYWCFRSGASSKMILLDYSNLTSSKTRSVPITRFPRSDSRNHRRYSILVRAFSLSQDAYLYNKQLQELSDLGGDLFSPEPGMMAGNLSCETTPERKVMGLVLAAEVTQKRAFLDSRYLQIPILDESFMISPDSQEQMYTFYNEMNYRPIKYAVLDGEDKMAWGPHRCINCIEDGGTQEIPDFWNNEN